MNILNPLNPNSLNFKLDVVRGFSEYMFSSNLFIRDRLSSLCNSRLFQGTIFTEIGGLTFTLLIQCIALNRQNDFLNQKDLWKSFLS